MQRFWLFATFFSMQSSTYPFQMQRSNKNTIFVSFQDTNVERRHYFHLHLLFKCKDFFKNHLHLLSKHKDLSKASSPSPFQTWRLNESIIFSFVDTKIDRKPNLHFLSRIEGQIWSLFHMFNVGLLLLIVQKIKFNPFEIDDEASHLNLYKFDHSWDLKYIEIMFFQRSQMSST